MPSYLGSSVLTLTACPFKHYRPSQLQYLFAIDAA